MATVDTRPGGPRTAEAGRPSALRALSAWGSAPWVGLICVLLVALFTAISPDASFFSDVTLRNVSLTASGIVLLCVAQAMLLGAAELDISQGATVVLTSVVAGRTVVAITGPVGLTGSAPHLALAVLAGVAVALGIGALVGLLNGLFVGWLGVNSLVTTLAMLGIATGTAQVITSGQDVSGLPGQLQTGFGTRAAAGIPLPAILAIVLVAIVWVLFTRTTFGLRTLAIGSSRSAAERGGIKVRRHVVRLFVISGMASGVAGLIDISRFATTNVDGHTSDALAALAGAVIGGTRLTGGRVSIVGAFLGALLAVILQVGLVVVDVEPFYQTIAVGAVLLAAVTFDRLRTRRAA